LFCLATNHHLDLARWLAVVALAVVASGYRPRFTGTLHWWIAFSFQSSAIVLDGGDQIAALLALFLIPVTLTDSRRWHWGTPIARTGRLADSLKFVVAVSCIWAIRLQVAGIYFNSAVAKFGVPEWRDGTALYYWLTDPVFGTSGWLSPLVRFLVKSGPGVALMTWGAIAIEILLAMALFMPARRWKYLLIAGIAFHSLIAICQGLVSFGVVMSGALILYLRPWSHAFQPNWQKVAPLRGYPPLGDSALVSSARDADWVG
jgi:antimicrobial peptide system SdpB family protein